MTDEKSPYYPRIRTTAEAMAEEPDPNTAFVVISGLTPEEKAHVIAVVTEVNRRLAEGEITLGNS